MYVYVSFSLSILDSIPDKNHHHLSDPTAISFKNLQLGEALPQTYARTKSPNDFNTFFLVCNVQGHNCATVKAAEAKYAKEWGKLLNVHLKPKHG